MHISGCAATLTGVGAGFCAGASCLVSVYELLFCRIILHDTTKVLLILLSKSYTMLPRVCLTWKRSSSSGLLSLACSACPNQRNEPSRGSQAVQMTQSFKPCVLLFPAAKLPGLKRSYLLIAIGLHVPKR